MPFELLGSDPIIGDPGLSGGASGGSGAGGAALPGSSLDINFAAGTWGTALGPELVTNGSFNTDIAGWTPAVTGSATVTWDATGALLLTGTASGQAAAAQTLNGLIVGQMYQLKFDNGGPNGVMVTVGSVLNVPSVIAGNANIFTFIAATTSVTLTFTRTGGAAFVAKVDNISCRQVNPQALGPEKIINGDFAGGLTSWNNSSTGTGTAVVSAGVCTLTATDGSNRGMVDQTLAAVVGATYQVSYDQGAGNATTIDLNGGAIYSAGSGAGRRTTTFIATATSHNLRWRINGNTGTNTVDNVSVAEVSPPIERILTTSRASTGMAQRLDGSWQDFAANVPRITDRGLLVEEARTNLALWSSAFGNAAWNAVPGATVVDNAVMAPDNTLTASVMTGTIADTTRRQTLTAATGVYTFSVWLKLPSGTPPLATSIYIRHTTNDLAAITITDQWQRFVVTTTTTITALTLQIGGASTWGIGKDIHAWGGQLELGAFATSPIKTTSAAVTRAWDNITIPPPVPWFNPAAGTFFADYTAAPIAGASQGLWGLDDGTTVERLILRQGASGAANLLVVDGSVVQVDAFTAASPNQKAAGAYALNDFAVTISGNLPTLDTAGTLPTINTYHLGYGQNTGMLNGYLKRVTYFPTRLPNAELQALTA